MSPTIPYDMWVTGQVHSVPGHNALLFDFQIGRGQPICVHHSSNSKYFPPGTRLAQAINLCTYSSVVVNGLASPNEPYHHQLKFRVWSLWVSQPWPHKCDGDEGLNKLFGSDTIIDNNCINYRVHSCQYVIVAEPDHVAIYEWIQNHHQRVRKLQ